MEPQHIRIVFDAMGGESAPQSPVEAAAAASLHGAFSSILVGETAVIDETLAGLEHNPERLSVHHSPPELGAAAAIDAAAALVSAKQAHAIVTATNPGLATLAMKRHVPMLDHVDTAAVATVIPTVRRRGTKDDPFCLLLDIGASLRPTAEDLVGFATMGAAYAKCISKNETPRVALLTNSRHPTAGPDEFVEAHKLLTALNGKGMEFIGNIEAHTIARGVADVVVCDGFTGTIVLRLLEGVADIAVDLARAAYEKKLRWRVGLSMLSGGLEKLRQVTDWEEYGGAPLLGFAAPLMVTHTSSPSRAFHNAAKLAAKMVREDMNGRIAENLALANS